MTLKVMHTCLGVASDAKQVALPGQQGMASNGRKNWLGLQGRLVCSGC